MYQQTNNPYAQTNTYGQQPPTNYPPPNYQQSNYPPPNYQQSNYPPPSYPETNYPPPPQYEDTYADTQPLNPPPQQAGEKFPEDNKFRDLLFLVLFILHIVGVAIILGVGISKKNSFEDNSPTFAPTGTDPTYYPSESKDGLIKLEGSLLARVVVICVCCGIFVLVFGSLWLNLMVRYTKQLIYIGIVVTFLVLATMAVVSFILGAIVPGVLFALIAVIWVLYYFLMRSRIPFAVAILRASSKIVIQYPSTQISAYISLFVSIGWMSFWSYTAIHMQYFSREGNYFLAVFLILSFYWVSEVIRNVVHVGVSGLFATWYFMSGGAGMPSNPTLKSFKRALTTSLGSIALGSLIVAIIKTIRQIVRSLRNERNALLVCLIDCILSCLDSLIRYFNHYAFCYVAIYGLSYCQAAKATWDLFKNSGFEVIVNDNLIDGVILTGTLTGALLTGILGGLMGHLWIDLSDVKESGDTANFWIVMAIVALLIGFVLMSMLLQIIASGTSTILVCFAEDNQALRRNNPELYEEFRTTYGGRISWL